MGRARGSRDPFAFVHSQARGILRGGSLVVCVYVCVWCVCNLKTKFLRFYMGILTTYTMFNERDWDLLGRSMALNPAKIRDLTP